MLTGLAAKVSHADLSVNQDCLPQAGAELSQSRETCVERAFPLANIPRGDTVRTPRMARYAPIEGAGVGKCGILAGRQMTRP
jgi:hypothetical protein